MPKLQKAGVSERETHRERQRDRERERERERDRERERERERLHPSKATTSNSESQHSPGGRPDVSKGIEEGFSPQFMTAHVVRLKLDLSPARSSTTVF